MAVKYKVEYGKDVYEQAGLGFADLLTFGTIIQPKMAGLIATSGAIMSENTTVTSEVYSFYKTVNEIFNPEEWNQLFRLFLLNEDNLLVINGVAMNTDDIEEHFSGDLLRAFSVAWGLAIKNLGKSEDFTKNLPEYGQKIVAYLRQIVEMKSADIKETLTVKSKKK